MLLFRFTSSLRPSFDAVNPAPACNTPQPPSLNFTFPKTSTLPLVLLSCLTLPCTSFWARRFFFASHCHLILRGLEYLSRLTPLRTELLHSHISVFDGRRRILLDLDASVRLCGSLVISRDLLGGQCRRPFSNVVGAPSGHDKCFATGYQRGG